MDADQRKMMKLEADLLRVPVEYFLDEGMIRAAAGTLIIAKFHERQLRGFGSTEVPATFEVELQRSGRGFRRLVRLTAQKHRSTGGYGNCENDDDYRFHGFRHAPHSSAAIVFNRKFF